MRVHQAMSSGIKSISPDTPLRDLWKKIFKRKVNSVPVVDKSNKLIGIVTKDDLLHQIYPSYSQYFSDLTSAKDLSLLEGKIKDFLGLKAKDIMNKKVIYTRKNTPVMRALSRMIVRSVNQLPVLDDKNKVIGIITKGDIFYTLFISQLRGQKKKKK